MLQATLHPMRGAINRVLVHIFSTRDRLRPGWTVQTSTRQTTCESIVCDLLQRVLR